MLVIPTILIALAALPFAAKSSAQSADEIRQYIDTEWLPAHLPAIQQAQEDYFRSYGEYWQGLATHTEASKPDYDSADQRPIDDKTIAADNLAVKPTDKLDRPSWSELFPNVITKLPASLRIDVYSGPKGMGYVINLDYCLDGVCYTRSINIGAEADRDLEWFKFEQPSEADTK